MLVLLDRLAEQVQLVLRALASLDLLAQPEGLDQLDQLVLLVLLVQQAQQVPQVPV